ncbi:hypothetical protein DFH08DRAFT_109062 [Mycena albidolilacea]|uniref:Uncharacterized protein n=1 Tax=Mycena albidolilacea TaxID=1033008 RepID=A0AAD7A743_9AGAR|nr:hypothetical protein DFH08DRAFT_109062 [Mycena albidolilacea]
MGAKYLCCLPLRLGVLLISLVQFFASALVSGLLTFVLVREAQGRPVFENNDHEEVFFHFSSRTKTVGIILAAVYGFVALIAFTGFVGAIRKRASYVRVFSSLLQGSLALQVVLVIAYFVLYFADKDEFKKICIGQSTDQKVIDNCNDLNKGKNVWAFVVAAIIPILSQAYGVYIVSSYAKKLRNEEFLDQESFGFKGPGYAPVSEESHPLTHQGPYPYADNSHSFGGKA